MLKIGLLLYPHSLPAGLLTGLDFFHAANLISGRKLFDVKLLGLERGSVLCAHKQEIKPQIQVQKFDPDIIILPGFWSRTPEDLNEVIKLNSKLQNYLNSVSKKTSIWSYCTGVIFHARTGRLKNQNATATWWLSKYLEKQFSDVDWNLGQSVAQARNDLTASGANGFYVLYEKVLKISKEPELLKEVQKYLMIPTSLKMNDPFYELEMTLSSSIELMKIKKIIEKLPASQINTEIVAQKLNISSKTLSRHLAKQTQWTPARLFRGIKFKQASELFLFSDRSVSEVCQKLGFEDESNFRKSFKRVTGMTPGEYQKKYKVNNT